MTSSYRVYIDESGDEGFTFLPNEQGSSRWLVLSALVFRRENDLMTVALAKQARELLKKPPKHPLHFRELKHEQRVPLARLIGQAQARAVSVLIHKPSIPEPENFQQQKYSLYRYACRLLLERVSWLCRDHHKAGQGNGRAELIFSNRSAMSYDDLRNYLTQLKTDVTKDVRIDWNVVDPALVNAVNHDQLAGLQLADAVATSVFYAVHKNQYGEVEERYLKLIAPTVYRHEGKIEGYGLKFWCEDKAEIARVLEAIRK
ncbi:MAG: DUF3800 domain-containing protein [Nitrosomonadales bacterium]|nr:DUF3800 domain-containing protein [Nitrosomonadales bacterium]